MYFFKQVRLELYVHFITVNCCYRSCNWWIDIGMTTTNIIIEDLRNYAKQQELGVDDILPVLRARLIEALTPPNLSRYSEA
jgi:hypothetical protein